MINLKRFYVDDKDMDFKEINEFLNNNNYTLRSFNKERIANNVTEVVISYSEDNQEFKKKQADLKLKELDEAYYELLKDGYEKITISDLMTKLKCTAETVKNRVNMHGDYKTISRINSKTEVIRKNNIE